jgi:hypothetical protein
MYLGQPLFLSTEGQHPHILCLQQDAARSFHWYLLPSDQLHVQEAAG